MLEKIKRFMHNRKVKREYNRRFLQECSYAGKRYGRFTDQFNVKEVVNISLKVQERFKKEWGIFSDSSGYWFIARKT